MAKIGAGNRPVLPLLLLGGSGSRSVRTINLRSRCRKNSRPIPVAAGAGTRSYRCCSCSIASKQWYDEPQSGEHAPALTDGAQIGEIAA